MNAMPESAFTIVSQRLFLWGKAGVEEFSREQVLSESAIAFRSLVQAELDASLPVGAATVSVHTQSGDTLRATVEQARGSIEKPLSDADLNAKVSELASERLQPAEIEELCSMLWQLQSMETIHPLMALTASAQP